MTKGTGLRQLTLSETRRGVEEAPAPTRHAMLAVTAATMAVAAAAGTVGMAGGGIDFGEPIASRLPLGSYPLAAAALAATVAAPMTAVAAVAWRGHRRAGGVAVVAGALLVGWIVVEIAVIRTYSWMQPVCAGWGLGVMTLGWRARRGLTGWSTHARRPA